MWTEITRPKYERNGLRYASDLTGAEWAILKPLLPPSPGSYEFPGFLRIYGAGH